MLGRFAIALDRHPADTVVRLTGDCPLTDPFIVAAALDLHRASSADYTSNVLPAVLPQGPRRRGHVGPALGRGAPRHTSRDREHVTPYLYRRPERFRLANLHSGHDLGEEWWTVDTAEDLDRVRHIVQVLDVAGQPRGSRSWPPSAAVSSGEQVVGERGAAGDGTGRVGRAPRGGASAPAPRRGGSPARSAR